jgi:hypothetical protein
MVAGPLGKRRKKWPRVAWIEWRWCSKPEWATYYVASDQAGQSRLWGGIHIQADDFTGRRIGSRCGKDAWALAQQYYSGKVGS